MGGEGGVRETLLWRGGKVGWEVLREWMCGGREGKRGFGERNIGGKESVEGRQ